MNTVKTLSLAGIIIFVYYLVYYVFMGITHPVPAPGDSWDYHIPISQSILDGSFLYPKDTTVFYGRFFPGSTEAFNSILILMHIPLTLSNIFAITALFFVCLWLGIVFRLPYYWSILFSVTVCSLTVFIRGLNGVGIDIWLCVFFLLSIVFLENPKKNFVYFLKAGFALGMVAGSKYSGIVLAGILLLVYLRSILPFITVKRFFGFLFPFSVFGLFWYVRNYIFLGNPFYPLPIFWFKGVSVYNDPIYNEIIQRPLLMLNAAFGEYNLWVILILGGICFFAYKRFIKKQVVAFGIERLYLIGLLNFIFFLSLPTSAEPWIMVSSFRYSHSTFVPLMLCVFLLFFNLKNGWVLGMISVGNMLMTLSLIYYPKLTLFYIPIGLLAIYVCIKNERRFAKASKKIKGGLAQPPFE